MKTRPVRRRRIPAYPTRLQVLEHPDLLRQYLPPSWLARVEMAGAVTVFLAANGLVKAGTKSTLGPDSAAVVAPIFAHGEGRGVTGCVVISPPVFLSEEEALQVITEELTKAGLNPTQHDVTLAGVTIPERGYDIKNKDGKSVWEIVEVPGKTRPLQADRKDEQRKVAVDFVSAENFFEKGGPRSSASIQRYEFKKIAKELAEKVKEQAKGIYFGTFYEPANTISRSEVRQCPRGEKYKTCVQGVLDKKKMESKVKLKAQVKDFVDWLKGQGVI